MGGQMGSPGKTIQMLNGVLGRKLRCYLDLKGVLKQFRPYNLLLAGRVVKIKVSIKEME